MVASKAQILVAIIISAPLLILAVSAKEPHLHNNVRTRVSFGVTSFNAGTNKNLTNNDQGTARSRKLNSISSDFLQAHNRARFHVGEPPLEWDRELAHYARRFASKRALDCKMLHSFGPYGENIFWAGRDHWTPEQVVQSWVSEHRYYNMYTNECAPGQMCGHYTQVVWRDTSKVGCARVRCLSGGLYAICAYDPPGNFIDESPFGSEFGAAPDKTPSASTLQTPPA